MGVHILEIGIKMGNGVIFTIRGCVRSVCNHPFLVGMMCFLIFMYRSSPFMFSLLVSASPILVCTAVLLGTLLSFGQPNVPEIEIEQKTTHGDVSKKSGVLTDAIVEQNESCCVERYSEKRGDGAAQSDEEPCLSASKFGESSHNSAPLVEERLLEIELGGSRELDDMKNKQKSECNEERLSDGEVEESHFALTQKANDKSLASEDEKSVADSFDSERVNVDSMDSPPRSPWKRVKDREDDEEEEEDDALDSGSDGAESSSPDASMADIMPMLDELHPLLDEDAPQAVPTSRDVSDAGSVVSLESPSSCSRESDDETENQEDLEVADDEDEQGDKEEQTKPAIVWTEEDQKNLMDLGSSEIERNQRLENLMLRRKARKHMSMVPEINLIDFESSDLPFHIAPISTARQNPFDLPNDSYDNSGLPPIPGSAPSILLPRRNPFDIPYDSDEQKLNAGDGFQEDLNGLQSREPFFRRHESFHVGPSIFAPNRQEKHDIRLRPYFVPERMVSEESSYSLFDRQSSEVSDSRLSSVPETESAVSVEDLDDQKLAEEDNPQELEVISTMEEVIEECLTVDQELASKGEVSEEDVPREPELILEMKHVAEHIGHGSQSSEEEDSSELGQSEKRDVEFDDHHYEKGSVDRPGEQTHSRGLSSSSLSEVSDRAFNGTERESLSMLDVRRDTVADELDASRRTSLGSTDVSIASTLPDDVPRKDPVYDSSPPAVRKNLSSSSGFSDVHVESDPGLPPELVKRMVSFTERDSEGKEIKKEILNDVEMLPEPSTLHQADSHESPRAAVNLQEHDNINSNSDMNIDGPMKSSDDKNLGKLEEKKHLPISVRESSKMPECTDIDKEIEKPVVLEPPHAELVTEETIVKHHEHGTSSKGNVDVSHHSRVDMDTASKMPKHIDTDKEIEKPVVLEPPQAELVVKETRIEQHEHGTPSKGNADVSHHSGVDIDTASKMPDLNDKEIGKPVVLEPPQAELVVEETIVQQHEHGTLNINTSSSNATDEKPILEDRSIENSNVDHKQVDSKEPRGEGTSSPMKKGIDDNAEKELKQNTNDGSAEVDAKETSSSIADQKPHDEVKAPKDLHSTSRVKGKGKKSKSSKSSSSSSSESSSSDSDK